jgi:hypothetical protein
VWEQVVAMASALSDMFLTEADLNLSFDKEKIGEPQPGNFSYFGNFIKISRSSLSMPFFSPRTKPRLQCAVA